MHFGYKPTLLRVHKRYVVCVYVCVYPKNKFGPICTIILLLTCALYKRGKKALVRMRAQICVLEDVRVYVGSKRVPQGDRCRDDRARVGRSARPMLLPAGVCVCV